MELETVNKLYLELSQFATAIPKRELEFRDDILLLQKAITDIKTVASGPYAAEECKDIADKALIEYGRRIVDRLKKQGA